MADLTVVPFFVATAAADEVEATGLPLTLAEFVLAKPEASSGAGASSVFALAEIAFDSIAFGDAPRPPRGGASLMVATSIDGRRGGLGALTSGLDGVSSPPSGETWVSSVF